MERAKRQGWKFGAKLVRGAYLDLETARARDKGYEVPIWEDIEHTHANYNRCVPHVEGPKGVRHAPVALCMACSASQDGCKFQDSRVASAGCRQGSDSETAALAGRVPSAFEIPSKEHSMPALRRPSLAAPDAASGAAGAGGCRLHVLSPHSSCCSLASAELIT